MSLHDDVFMSTYLHPAYVLLQGQDSISRYETTVLKSIRILRFTPQESADKSDRQEEEEDNAAAPLTNANKNLHRRWLMAGRRLAEAAEEEEEEWTDEEGAE
jgi:membrane carboxypeptidase/penicillin-binding protein PbpC